MPAGLPVPAICAPPPWLDVVVTLLLPRDQPAVQPVVGVELVGYSLQQDLLRVMVAKVVEVVAVTGSHHHRMGLVKMALLILVVEEVV